MAVVTVYYDPALRWLDEDALIAEDEDREALAAVQEILTVSDNGSVWWSAAIQDADGDAF